MGFVEHSYVTVKTFIGDVAKKTEGAIDVQKVKFAIAELAAKLDDQYAELGELCYKEISSEEPIEGIEEQKQEIIDAINELKGKISDKRTDLDILLNNVTCEACNSVNTAGSKFCSNCGKEL